MAFLLRDVGVYAIHFTQLAEKVLARMPLAARAEVYLRVNEIAGVAHALVSPAADSFTSALRFDVAGYTVSYIVKDSTRTLTVLSVFRSLET